MGVNMEESAGSAVNETIRCIYARRSVRLFSDRPVSGHDLTMILEAANQAPSAHNQQTWRFSVLRDGPGRSRLTDSIRRRAGDFSRASSVLLRRAARSIASAQVVVVVTNTGDLIHRGKELTGSGEEAGSDIFHTMEVQSSAAAVENLLLAATSLGIGSVWLGVLVLLQNEILELVGEPAAELAAVVALGYPAESTRAPEKAPLDAITRYLD